MILQQGSTVLIVLSSCQVVLYAGSLVLTIPCDKKDESRFW